MLPQIMWLVQWYKDRCKVQTVQYGMNGSKIDKDAIYEIGNYTMWEGKPSVSVLACKCINFPFYSETL